MERHLYRVSSLLPNVGVVTQAASCLTCNFNDNLEPVLRNIDENRNEEKLEWQNKKKMQNISIQNLKGDMPRLEYLKNKSFNITRQYKSKYNKMHYKYYDNIIS